MMRCSPALRASDYTPRVSGARTSNVESSPSGRQHRFDVLMAALRCICRFQKGIEMAIQSSPDSTQYWFVGAYFDDREPRDQTERFISEGIWENGFEDRHLDEVKTMRPGDRIAIKAAYIRKNDLPFDNRGNIVSTMGIKATGVITRNLGDGRHVEVDWTRMEEAREWYFFTGRATVWKVLPGEWKRDALIAFAFGNQPQDLKRFRNEPFWAKRFGDENPTPDQDFRWTSFYEDFASTLLTFRTRRSELLNILRELQERHPTMGYLVDRDEEGQRIPLADICPFTIFGSFNRGITSSRRTAIAADWARHLGVSEQAPVSFDAIPLLNNMNSWFFPYAPERGENDIENLWDAFEAGLAFAESSDDNSRVAFAPAYDAARRVHGVGGKLSIGLFWTRPWSFLPLDGQSRNYLRRELMFEDISTQATGQSYLTTLDTLTSKFEDAEYPVHSFPDLSWNAYLERDSSNVTDESESSPESPVLSDEVGPPILPAAPYSISDIVADGCFLPADELKDMLERWRSKKNIILQGPPGTGKTWLARRLAFALIGTKGKKSAIRAVQFHPNASYEDFVRGWRPSSDGKLALVDGPFLDMVERANSAPDVAHVVLIEEINRGNPVQIFGELLTLIEAGKRSPREALHLAYPRYPEETVHVPSNLYIIGTMNLADRSLAIMDLAFRRRFGFVTLSPAINDTWLQWMKSKHDVSRHELEDVRSRFNELNRTIAEDSALGKQFVLGQSFVTPPSDEMLTSFEDWFRAVIHTEIVPTLEEYWFDRPERVASAKQALLTGSQE